MLQAVRFVRESEGRFELRGDGRFHRRLDGDVRFGGETAGQSLRHYDQVRRATVADELFHRRKSVIDAARTVSVCPSFRLPRRSIASKQQRRAAGFCLSYLLIYLLIYLFYLILLSVGLQICNLQYLTLSVLYCICAITPGPLQLSSARIAEVRVTYRPVVIRHHSHHPLHY